jgi:hypothetical protein
MMLRAGLVAGAMAAALAMAGPASAVAVIYTYKGSVSEIHNVSGAILGGSIKVGDDVTLVFARDDDTPGAVQLTTPDSSRIRGPTENLAPGNLSPVVATLMMGGQSFDFGANTNFESHNGDQRQQDSSAFEEFRHATQDYTQFDDGYRTQLIFAGAYGYGTDYLINSDYHTLSSLTAAGTPGFNWGGGLEFTQDRQSGGNYSTFVQFTLNSLTVGGAAPEPAAWALMIGGFGMTGGMLRRRRAVRILEDVA